MRYREIVTRYWAEWVVAAVLFAVTFVVATYLNHRADLADHRAEAQRRAICAILANIPGEHPLPALVDARRVFARPGHPGDCEPLPSVRHARPRAPRPPGVSPVPRAPVVVVIPPSPAPRSTPVPGRGAHPAPRPHPRVTPTPSPHPTPTPTPRPSPPCLRHPVRCLL